MRRRPCGAPDLLLTPVVLTERQRSYRGGPTTDPCGTPHARARTGRTARWVRPPSVSVRTNAALKPYLCFLWRLGFADCMLFEPWQTINAARKYSVRRYTTGGSHRWQTKVRGL